MVAPSAATGTRVNTGDCVFYSRHTRGLEAASEHVDDEGGGDVEVDVLHHEQPAEQQRGLRPPRPGHGGDAEQEEAGQEAVILDTASEDTSPVFGRTELTWKWMWSTRKSPMLESSSTTITTSWWGFLASACSSA